MKQVSKEEFFRTMGPLNVNPRVDVQTLKSRYHVSDWTLGETRQLMGRSESDSHGNEPTKFFLV